MASPQEKLADSLEILEALQKQGVVAVRSSDLSRTHRERLLVNGFLREVMKGWYIPARPDETAGESTAWYASFWDFCAAYLEQRFEEQWCLSAEQSLFLHTGRRTVPKQLLVKAPRGRNRPTSFLHGTSVFDLRAKLPPGDYREKLDALRVYSLPAALVFSRPRLFAEDPTEGRAALAMIADASDVLGILLEGGHSTVGGRLAGAFRNIGRDKIADQIVTTMKSAGYDVREKDPFDEAAPFAVATREPSPYVIRMRLMWHAMRADIVGLFPAAPKTDLEIDVDIDAYLKRVEEVYVEDAYHSLSIEGYRVTPELIRRVRSGDWDPGGDEDDGSQHSALTARGYYDAFRSVAQSVAKVLDEQDPGGVAGDDHGTWYRKLFGPSVTAGIVRPGDLAGYRSSPVYIRNSQHTPPSREAVRDMMPVLFELLSEEPNPAVRAVLGHFVFVYIHPYADGNGRMGRFLMNVMLASGGYPWTVVPVDLRRAYMAALEAASIGGDIKPFAAFLGELVTNALLGKPSASIPSAPEVS